MTIDEIRDTIIGMDYHLAATWLFNQGFTPRKTKLDGRPCLVTRDYRLDRVNVSLVNGIVVDADIG